MVSKCLRSQARKAKAASSTSKTAINKRKDRSTPKPTGLGNHKASATQIPTPGTPSTYFSREETPSSISTHSCEYCKNIVVDPDEDRKKNNDKEDTANQGIVFDCTFKDIKSWAKLGCQFFAWIMDSKGISRETIYASMPDEPSRQDEARWKLYQALPDMFMWSLKHCIDAASPISLRVLDPEQSSKLDNHRFFMSSRTLQDQINFRSIDIYEFQLFGLYNPETRKISFRTLETASVFTPDSDPASFVISTRPIEQNPGSIAIFPKIASWLEECEASHTKCKLKNFGIMPARLIEINKTDSQYFLRLCDTRELGSVSFAALSYCWGVDQRMKCLDDVLTQLMVEIPFSELPQTIKDAIIVCDSTGVHYLWVDVLCILQDNQQDKTSEIAKMPHIYSRAIFTIIAAWPQSAYDGFLRQRPIESQSPAFRLPFRFKGNDTGSVTLLSLPDGEKGPEEPIHERGWTLQERVFARRIIEFGSRQTRWFCEEVGNQGASNVRGFVDKGYVDGWKAMAENPPLDKGTLEILNSESMSRFDASKDYGYIVGEWDRIVEAYTRRKLSLATDRPQAISGIAELFGELLVDQYKAGLWTCLIHSQLLWKIPREKRLPRPTVHQGPSWSWTSVNGPVEPLKSSANDWRPDQCQAQIIEIDCSPLNNSAPYGAILESSGHLRIRGRVCTGARAAPVEFGKDDFYVVFFGTNGAGFCLAHARMFSDAIEEDFDETRDDNDGESKLVSVLEIQSGIHGGTWTCHGLVLRQIPEKEGWYRRIGTFQGSTTSRVERLREETTEEFELRVALEFDWFRNESYSIVTII